MSFGQQIVVFWQTESQRESGKSGPKSKGKKNTPGKAENAGKRPRTLGNTNSPAVQLLKCRESITDFTQKYIVCMYIVDFWLFKYVLYGQKPLSKIPGVISSPGGKCGGKPIKA